MGNGIFNIGLGYVNSYKNWQSINATQFLGEFLRTLPADWELPAIEELKKNKSVRAWRLPMGFTAWPPWRPGVLFTGDSLGAGKPASGAGISKALESGLAAGECAIAALQNGGPDDFTNYAQRMEAAWGREYRRGRYFHKLLGSRGWPMPASSSSTTPGSATECSRRCTRKPKDRSTPSRSSAACARRPRDCESDDTTRRLAVAGFTLAPLSAPPGPGPACGRPCPQRRGRPAWRGSSPVRCVSVPAVPARATNRVCGPARSR